MEAKSNHLESPIIMMDLGLGVTIVTTVLYVLMRVGHVTPLTIEDVFGQIFFFGIVLEVSKLRK